MKTEYYIDKLYALISTSIPFDISEKIFVPISGGLDSRVLAAFVSQVRPINLSFVYFTKNHYRHTAYALMISKILEVDNFLMVNVDREEAEKDRWIYEKNDLGFNETFTAFRILNDVVDLSEYTLYIPHGLEFLTGSKINPLTFLKAGKIEKEYLEKWRPAEERWINSIGKYFTKAAISAVWNENLVDFCLDLPIIYRFHQYLYRQMIKKYFPELAAIERDVMDVKMDIGELKYFWARMKFRFNKHKQIERWT